MSDEKLNRSSIERASGGGWISDSVNRPGIDQVLAEHFSWLSRMCLFSVRDPSAAEDCLQEVLKEIAGSYPSFSGGSKVTTWMFTIAKRTISRFRKKAWRYGSRQVLGREHDAAEDEIAVEPPDGAFEREQLEKAITQLSERQRQAVMLHYIEDLSVEQGAERMGCSVSSFKTHLLRARERLRELIEGKDGQGRNERNLRDKAKPGETGTAKTI